MFVFVVGSIILTRHFPGREHAGLLWLGTWYSVMLFCSLASSHSADHFHKAVHAFFRRLNSTLKSGRSILIAAQIGASSHGAPLVWTLMTGNVLFIGCLETRSTPSRLCSRFPGSRVLNVLLYCNGNTVHALLVFCSDNLTLSDLDRCSCKILY